MTNYTTTINGRSITLTEANVKGLRREACAAGDLEQVVLCVNALDGFQSAQVKCAEAIAENAAQLETIIREQL